MTNTEAAEILSGELIKWFRGSGSGESRFCEPLRLGAEALERVVTLEVQEMRVKARAWDLAIKARLGKALCGRLSCNYPSLECHYCAMSYALAQAREEIEQEASR